MKKICFIVLFVSLFLFLYLNGYTKSISLTNIQAHQDEIIFFTQEYPIMIVIAAVIIFIIISNFHIMLGGLLLLMLLGALFGPIGGSLVGILSSFSGAISSFFISRYFFHDFFQKKYAKKLNTINKHLKNNGFWYLLFLRFMPAVPQQTLHVIAGSSKISTADFLLATFIGLVPPCVIYSSLGNIIWNIADLNNITALKNAMIIYGLLLLFLLPLIFYKIKTNHKKQTTFF